MTENRRLAAVMFLDMVGYSALMARSQAAALACVRDLEAIVREMIPARGGRLVKFLGDGTMAEFPTAGAAYQCAEALQERIRSREDGGRLQVRIGLHLGELVEDKGDLFGDAVNIAARVLPLADPGGIAMTAAFHAEIKNQFSPRGGFLPSRRLKNIPGRAAIFAVPPAGASLAGWTLRRRLFPAVPALAALALALAGAGAWQRFRTAAGPVRVGLLYIQTEGETLNALARAVEDELAARVGAAPGFLWMTRAGILELFEAEGLSDLTQIEKLERKACKVARKGGLQYSLVGQLRAAGAGSWRLDSKIVCTKTRTIVGSLSSVAATAEAMAADQQRQLVAWANGYNLLPKEARPALP